MEGIFKFRGQILTPCDIDFIRRLIGQHPGSSRRALSVKLCQAWHWTQPNGQLRDMYCRSLMLELHRRGRIELPPVRYQPPNNVIARQPPQRVMVDTTPLCAKLSALQPLQLHQVRGTPEEKFFNGLVSEHHYLGYTKPVGENLKYVIWSQGRPVGAMAWCSPVRHLGPRDRFIGWSAQARRQNIHWLAYNTRFLILPWVQVPHLASHLLGRMAKQVPLDWQRLYARRVYYLETFVDPTRYRGTCYRAANWIDLGLTTGRGKNDQTNKPNRPKKHVLGYPLVKDFRKRLGVVK